MTIVWIIVFIVSLAALVKGADWFLESSEKIGLAFGLSPFIIGVLIVGLGTSFPELASGISAILQNASEIVPANAIGSNISNILLIVGIAAIIGRRLTVTKSLIDLDIPLLALSTVLLLGILWDKQVNIYEAILLIVTYTIYLLYVFIYKDDGEAPDAESTEVLPSRQTRRKYKTVPVKRRLTISKTKIKRKDILLLLAGLVGLIVGAKYMIQSVIAFAEIFNISPALISISAVAIGTSLPELIVSIKAALARKSEIALGNIFGSNVFNALVVIGVPGLFQTLEVDEKTFTIGLPALALTTLLFVISGISRRIHIWEGAMYLAVYVFFIAKLFDLF